MTDTVILYHASCPDGFGGAYAAWKKFGDKADYIPVSYGHPTPEGIEGAHLYFVDFCYDQATMNKLVAESASVTVLDHHEGVQAVTESMPEHVFDSNRSGATIAWGYFHPGVPVPPLLEFIEDDDTYHFALADTKAVLAYVIVNPFDFEEWDTLIEDMKDRTKREAFFMKARTYAEYFALTAKYAASKAHLVSFEGYECYFANSHPHITMKSAVAKLLYTKQPPLSLIVTSHPEGFGVSIRSDGSVDVAEIARKFGGNGHPGSAGFQIPLGVEVPWKSVEHENIGD
jgi:oligoribonuclease NrnB/cAMP/cGMP phosphodiesterase (DHH superfamily)